MKNIAIFGSTGSIGVNTLDVVRLNPGQYNVYALAANTNADLIFQQCLEFKPEIVVLVDQQAALKLNHKIKLSPLKTIVLSGEQALNDVAKDSLVDIVVAAIVGAAGLQSTLAAAKAGKRILLANKESLVMSGKLLLNAVKQNNAQLLPVDSEHNAIFQSLPLDYQQNYLNQSVTDFGVSSIILTGSGGPFLDTPLNELISKTPAQACKHPNWSMGQKISVDSATMMNKGLELIEACWLFSVAPTFVEVLIHPQSVIHSMVRYLDGSIIAQMGSPDMRTPISHCLGFPKRLQSGAKPFDFIQSGGFSFLQPDYQRYPNLKLAAQAFAAGQEATTILNAANEISVARFLDNQIKFTQIAELNERVLNAFSPKADESLESLLDIDRQAREIARTLECAC